MNYYLKSENIGDDLFMTWANKVGCFKETTRLDLLSRVDWICIAKNGKTVNCELKVRLSLDWDDLLIEPKKYNYLIYKWNTEKIIPWYLCLCGDLVYLFDLRYCKVFDKGVLRIWDGGELSFKYELRYSLLTSQAFKFKNGEII